MSFGFGQWKVGQHAATPEQEQLVTAFHNRVAYRIESRYSSTTESPGGPNSVTESLSELLIRHKLENQVRGGGAASSTTPTPDTYYCHGILLSAIALKLNATNAAPHLILGFLSGPRISDHDFEHQKQNVANLVPELFDLVGWDFRTMDAVVDFLQPFIEQAAARNRQLSLAGQSGSELDFSAGYARPRSSSDAQGGSQAKGTLHWTVGVALWKHREGCRQKAGTRAKLAVLAAVHFAETASLCSPSPTSSPLIPSDLAANVLLATVTMVADSECPGALDYESFCQLPGLCLLPLAPVKEFDFTKLRDLYPTSPCVIEAVCVVLLHFKLLGQTRKALDVLAGLIRQPGGPELSVLLDEGKADLRPSQTPWLRVAKRLRDVVAKIHSPFPRPGFIDDLGVAYFDTGVVYRGEFRDASQKGAIDQRRVHGKGVMTFADGTIHDGEWNAGRYEGKGDVTWATGDTYKGDFQNDKFHGQGEHHFSNGDRYKGEFKEGELHGEGVFTFADGSNYEGELVHGKFHGEGERTLHNGVRYKGEFKENEWHGKGLCTSADGSNYEGEFVHDKFHGQGEQNFSSGDRYEGEFKEDERHGKGLYTYADGGTYEGEFEHGKFHGHGERTHHNGDRYRGEFKEDERHGKGLYACADGGTYEGDFLRGLLHGKGKLISSDGTTAEGTWERGKQHGNFRRRPEVGAPTAEVWKDGVRLSSRKLPKLPK